MEEFLLNPNIPTKRVVCAVVDFRTASESINTLNSFGIQTILTPKISSLQTPVYGHTDMMLHHLGKEFFVVANEVYDYFKEQLPKAEIIKGSSLLKPNYPNDILYNCAAFGNHIICNTAHTAVEILSNYQNMNKKILNVKQGYSKCSICIINENAIITSDEGIAKVCIKNNIDVLKINPGYIELSGMNYGFIGGAAGLIAENILAVNGEIKTHPDCDKIISFCKNYEVDICELKKGYLADIGSIAPILQS